MTNFIIYFSLDNCHVMKTVLILGRKGTIVNQVAENINRTDLHIIEGTTIEDVHNSFANNPISTVIMGAGIDLDIRIRIIRFVFENSKSTTVHMKDWESGPGGMLPFVLNILNGI